MRILIAAAAACTLVASAAYAQMSAPSQMPAQKEMPAQMPAMNGPANPAVKSMSDNNSAKPVAGANSFTMAEAKSFIEGKGYTAVAGLTKDNDGIWRGTASKDGKAGPVSLDYQGNVN